MDKKAALSLDKIWLETEEYEFQRGQPGYKKYEVKTDCKHPNSPEIQQNF